MAQVSRRAAGSHRTAQAGTGQTGSGRTGSGKTKPPRLGRLSLHDLTDSAAPEAPGTFDGLRLEGQSFDGFDLQGSTFSECEFLAASMTDTVLRGARFLDCRFSGLYAPVFRAPRTTFREVVLEGSRLGSAELYNGAWDSVHVDGGKLDFLNLRGTRLSDVLFTNCTIEELDLSGVEGTRVAFRDCRIASMDLSGAVLQDVDLRTTEFRSITHLAGLQGATIDEDQLMMLAPLLAVTLGLRIEG